MAAPSTTGELLEMVTRSGICPQEKLTDRLRTVAELPEDVKHSAAVLVRQGLLTQFQARLLLAGRSNGLKLGPYVIREQIGQGGMGIVYLAEHETLRRQVALKVLLPPKGGDQKLAIERFLREARSAAALNHPNIVRVSDAARQGAINYLVMEYVDGNSLADILAKAGPITPSRAVGYVCQAAAGLQHAYEQGFIHRDIKPANLMVAKDGTVKILDMGLARSFTVDDNLTEAFDRGAVVGTVDYISPEQALNEKEIDIRADIYSLGATFFTLVTNRVLFEGTTPQKLMQHQMKEPPSLAELDPTFPEELAEVISKMLAKDRDDRYETPVELIEALAPWLPKGTDSKSSVGLSGGKSSGSNKHRLTRPSLEKNRTTRRMNKVAAQRPNVSPVVNWVGAGLGAVVVLGIVIWAVSGLLSSPAQKSGDSSVANSARPASVSDGSVVYRLDPATIPNFRERCEGGVLSGRLPAGVKGQCWQKGCVGEFGRDIVAGVPTLWLTNQTTVTATQYAIELEAGCQCPLEEEHEYTVRLEYQTRGRPVAHLFVQSQKYAQIAGQTLSPSEDRWQLATLKFRRQAGVPVQIAVGVKEGGPDTGLSIRFVEVIH